MSRMRFSHRKNITPVKVEIQRESMDDALKNKLWSMVMRYFLGEEYNTSNIRIEFMENLRTIKDIWINFLALPLDNLPTSSRELGKTLRELYFNWKWYEIYDFIEALAQRFEGADKRKFISAVNTILESEKAAYRFVDDEIGEFTSATEIEAIEEAIKNTSGLSTVNTHLREALAKLTDRVNPDYRNSIKESISAVEATCKFITQDKRATLGDAIKKLKGLGIELHPALEKAWGNLYGYTSDESGIRHALSESPRTTFSDAKYMLVSCSAFVNYLLELAREAGMALRTP